jgi:hypothetical protein
MCPKGGLGPWLLSLLPGHHEVSSFALPYNILPHHGLETMLLSDHGLYPLEL